MYFNTKTVAISWTFLETSSEINARFFKSWTRKCQHKNVTKLKVTKMVFHICNDGHNKILQNILTLIFKPYSDKLKKGQML